MPNRYVVIGNPVAHSMSPAIHADFARQCGLSLQYMALLAPLGEFEQTLRTLKAAGVSGANVTVPFKHDAFERADVLSPAAQFAKAANTLTFLSDGQVYADNTDGGGLCLDLCRQLHKTDSDLSDFQVLMIGAGGAASGCIAAFQAAGVQHLTVLNRTLGKAQELAQRAQAIHLPAVAGVLNTPVSDFDIPAAPIVVVNASSSSLKGELPEIVPQWYAHAVLVYDMMYAPQATALMQAVLALGKPDLKVSDGLGMLVFQAQLAFEQWTGQRPDALRTLKTMRSALLGKALRS